MVGYVFSQESTSSEDLHTFPGFPGRFMPGVPLSLVHLGISEDEADDAIERLSLPLQKVSMTDAEATAEIDRGDNFAPSGGEEVRQEAVAEDLATGLSHADLDALAEEHGVTFVANMNKAEKAAKLAEAGVEPPASEEAEG